MHDKANLLTVREVAKMAYLEPHMVQELCRQGTFWYRPNTLMPDRHIVRESVIRFVARYMD